MLLFSQLPEDHLESKVLTSVYSNEYDGYYVNLTDVSIVDLHSELNELISTSHTKIYYVDNWDHIAEFHKSPYDEGNITLFYTQRSHDSNDSRWYDGGTLIGNDDSWNREHIWPKSHGDFTTDDIVGTDLHNIVPTDYSVNYDRWAKDFGEASTPHNECSGCYYADYIWEPPNIVKGDVARILFYMDVRYEGLGDEPSLELVDKTSTYPTSSSGKTELGKLCTMYQWHVLDPVDSRELERNMAIFEIQGNRNPFIDYSDFVMDIWGADCDSDFDNDGLWGIEDSDDDNDGVDDNNDSCLRTIISNESVNDDGCGLYELDSDGDGYTDDVDAFVNDISQWADSDSDGCGDNLEGNNSDSLPNDPSECNDSDGDGIGDNSDSCPGFDDAIDVDSDNVSDGCDDFIDSDNDGVIDENDDCENTPLGIQTTPNGCNLIFNSNNNPSGESKFPVIGISIVLLIVLIAIVSITVVRSNPNLLQNIFNKDTTEITPSTKPEPPKHWSDDEGNNFRKMGDNPVQIWDDDEKIWNTFESEIKKPELPKHWSDGEFNYRQIAGGPIQKWDDNNKKWDSEG
ncbi:MAG: hypothetical protein HOE69_03470 [Euryarchaeota archaeon]|nr:hypothetical protein [Euryarchaeota archaeon]